MKYFLLLLLSHTVLSMEASKLIEQITGTQISIRSKEFKQVKELLKQNQKMQAVELILSFPSFYNTKLLEFANIMLTHDSDLYYPLSDMNSLVLGLYRDGADFRQVLTGNSLYLPTRSVYSQNDYERSNKGFEILAKKDNYHELLKIYSSPLDPANTFPNTGVLSSRAWAQIYYSAGTNRRAVKGVFNSFLCTDIEVWKDNTLIDDWVRRDVTRSPGGETKVFQNKCKACHAPMDALSGAFAYSDYESDRVKFSRSITPKYLQNTNIFPGGYVTFDSSWENLLAEKQNKRFEFDMSKVSGKNLTDFASMVASSGGFAKCITSRVINSVCRQKVKLTSPLVKKLSKDFNQLNFNLKKLFKKVLLNESCN